MKKAWQEAAEANNLPRISWAEVLGESLPIFVFRRLKERKTEEQIFDEIWDRALNHPNCGRVWDMGDEMHRLIKINVGARTAEFNRFRSVMHATNHGRKRCICGGFAQHRLNCEG